jgi:hypothetical protein
MFRFVKLRFISAFTDFFMAMSACALLNFIQNLQLVTIEIEANTLFTTISMPAMECMHERIGVRACWQTAASLAEGLQCEAKRTSFVFFLLYLPLLILSSLANAAL